MVKYEERERDATAPFHRSKYFFSFFFLRFKLLDSKFDDNTNTNEFINSLNSLILIVFFLLPASIQIIKFRIR